MSFQADTIDFRYWTRDLVGRLKSKPRRKEPTLPPHSYLIAVTCEISQGCAPYLAHSPSLFHVRSEGNLFHLAI